MKHFAARGYELNIVVGSDARTPASHYSGSDFNSRSRNVCNFYRNFPLSYANSVLHETRCPPLPLTFLPINYSQQFDGDRARSD
jgi:hypothetical protein